MRILHLYMKSGNVIKVRRVKDWEIVSNGNAITAIKIERGKPFYGGARGLVVATIVLDQIEAIVEK